jgi:hypothetical protein
MSDLDGGFAERTYKPPNPFYFIPGTEKFDLVINLTTVDRSHNP